MTGRRCLRQFVLLTCVCRDFTNFQSTSTAECSQRCQADTRCKAWSLGKGRCWLKDAVPNGNRDRDFTSGTKYVTQDGIDPADVATYITARTELRVATNFLDEYIRKLQG